MDAWRPSVVSGNSRVGTIAADATVSGDALSPPDEHADVKAPRMIQSAQTARRFERMLKSDMTIPSNGWLERVSRLNCA